MQVQRQSLLAHYGASHEEFDALLAESCKKVLPYVGFRCQQLLVQTDLIQAPPGYYLGKLPLNALTDLLITAVIFQLHSQGAYNSSLLTLFPSESLMLSVAEEATWLVTGDCLGKLSVLGMEEPSWVTPLLEDGEPALASSGIGQDSSQR